MQNIPLKIKNTFNFILLFLVFNFAFYISSTLAITGLVFTTEPQTIAVAAVSAKLTVSSGEAPGETADLFFISSSATGEFSSNAGDWQPVAKVTWNSNWANRSFYYRDQTAGEHTLTVTLIGRTSNDSWSATQAIIVGAGGPDIDNNNRSATSTDPAPAITINPAAGGGTLSAHAAPAPLSQAAAREPFQVSVGRPRLASIHQPVIFRAVPDGSIPTTIRYDWSFGDGAWTQNKQTVTHSYQFPGEYNVVLNATGAAEETAISRTTVLVTPPLITFGAAAADRVVLANRSAYELNLGGWRLNQGPANFIFPADTIVSANRSLNVPATQLGFAPAPGQLLTLFFPDGQAALETPSLAELTKTLERLSAQLQALKK